MNASPSCGIPEPWDSFLNENSPERENLPHLSAAFDPFENPGKSVMRGFSQVIHNGIPAHFLRSIENHWINSRSDGSPLHPAPEFSKPL
jgi:hypothetical protein